MTKPAIPEEAEGEHRMVRHGVKASCACGAWECRTNEVVEKDIARTLRRQYSLHLSDQAESATESFKAVWDEVFAIVQEASGNGFELKPNGNSERRSLEYIGAPAYRPTGMRPEIITISLSQNRHATIRCRHWPH